MTISRRLMRLASAGIALLCLPLLPRAVEARPNPGGIGGPASGLGVRPGAGVGRPGVGAGGVGGPYSGGGVRPGVGWGAPGPGLTRAPAAAYGAAVYHPAWNGGGYWAARPWTYGWYGATPVAWAAAAGVASTAAITAAVNASVAASSAVIVVPGSPYQLNYASVLGLPNSRVSFTYISGGLSLSATGDCSLGLVDGQAVRGVSAQLLHAACSVAYGPGT
ncbi:MAG: hypothetical protein WAM11_02020 [Cyanobium sp.]